LYFWQQIMALHFEVIARSTGTLLLRDSNDVVICRQTVAKIAEELGFSAVGKTMLVTAASELARNALIHGGGGEVFWTVLREADRAGIRLAFQDHGPGIPNLELAMTDGWTSGAGLGLGLSGARRLVHEFAIDSTVGTGTRVVIVRWQQLPVTLSAGSSAPGAKSHRRLR
jgi:serine/threonine-protein kinase RsbT